MYPIPKQKKSILITVMLVSCMSFSTLSSQSISVSGNWNTTIDVTHLELPNTPGSDIIDTYLSSDDVSLNISVWGVSNYTVYVSRTDSPGWPSGWALAVRRTSDGFGFGGSINGGTNFITIPNNLPPYGALFFTGNSWRLWIGIVLRLSNVTINSALAATTYSTRVTYTLTQP
jgi:hypothetical protein